MSNTGAYRGSLYGGGMNNNNTDPYYNQATPNDPRVAASGRGRTFSRYYETNSYGSSTQTPPAPRSRPPPTATYIPSRSTADQYADAPEYDYGYDAGSGQGYRDKDWNNYQPRPSRGNGIGQGRKRWHNEHLYDPTYGASTARPRVDATNSGVQESHGTGNGSRQRRPSLNEYFPEAMDQSQHVLYAGSTERTPPAVQLRGLGRGRSSGGFMIMNQDKAPASAPAPAPASAPRSKTTHKTRTIKSETMYPMCKKEKIENSVRLYLKHPAYFDEFANREYCDVRFVCENGEFVHTSKLLLIAAAPFLGTMLDNQLPGEMTIISVEDYPKWLMTYFVEFIRTGKLYLEEQNSVSLLRLLFTFGWTSERIIMTDLDGNVVDLAEMEEAYAHGRQRGESSEPESVDTQASTLRQRAQEIDSDDDDEDIEIIHENLIPQPVVPPPPPRLYGVVENPFAVLDPSIQAEMTEAETRAKTMLAYERIFGMHACPASSVTNDSNSDGSRDTTSPVTANSENAFKVPPSRQPVDKTTKPKSNETDMVNEAGGVPPAKKRKLNPGTKRRKSKKGNTADKEPESQLSSAEVANLQENLRRSVIEETILREKLLAIEREKQLASEKIEELNRRKRKNMSAREKKESGKTKKQGEMEDADGDEVICEGVHPIKKNVLATIDLESDDNSDDEDAPVTPPKVITPALSPRKTSPRVQAPVRDGWFLMSADPLPVKRTSPTGPTDKSARGKSEGVGTEESSNVELLNTSTETEVDGREGANTDETTDTDNTTAPSDGHEEEDNNVKAEIQEGDGDTEATGSIIRIRQGSRRRSPPPAKLSSVKQKKSMVAKMSTSGGPRGGLGRPKGSGTAKENGVEETPTKRGPGRPRKNSSS